MDKERQKEMSRVGLSIWCSAVGRKERLTAGGRHTAMLDVFSGSHLEGSERENRKMDSPQGGNSHSAQPVPEVIPSIPTSQGRKPSTGVTGHVGKDCSLVRELGVSQLHHILLVAGF